jgi:hypothetical protein
VSVTPVVIRVSSARSESTARRTFSGRVPMDTTKKPPHERS